MYGGIHPRSAKPDGGLCSIKGVHKHALPPASEALFRKHDGVYVFVGDPVPFGFGGQKYRFYGHHPLTMSELGDEQSYCYLNGPHWHTTAPSDTAQYVERESVFYFAGDFPQAYQRERVRFEVGNSFYLSLPYERPVVQAAPPREYRGPVVEVHLSVPVPVQVRVQQAPPPPVFVIEERRENKKFKHKKLKAKKFKSRD